MISKAKLHRKIRKAHRYLGLFLGIQFLAWTLGGLYFSWTDIHSVRGDTIRKEPVALDLSKAIISPKAVLEHWGKENLTVERMQLIDILGEPYFQVWGRSESDTEEMHIRLVHATSGDLKSPLSKDEAVALAKSKIKYTAVVEAVDYLTETHAHHEYRSRALPAYAIRFGPPVNTTAYVATELGTVERLRNDQWRVFDFLWMLHTMDYQGRDDFNNLLLRLFSILGLITISSGFLLFFVSRKKNVK